MSVGCGRLFLPPPAFHVQLTVGKLNWLFVFLFLCCTSLEKEDFLENANVLSCFIQLKSVLLISCVFWISAECNEVCLITADTSCHQWMCTITNFEGSVWNQPVFHSVSMLQLVRKTWWLLLGFSRRLLIVMFCVAESAGWLAAQNPVYLNLFSLLKKKWFVYWW